ncbi:STAS domain-containing protein [Streptomyces sp. NPDC008265]|uniref:STAS domain-containing protein n=1 Tax=Streptomyces sp. NPDC008265 TaxID=3364824 RepID=UPI0036F06E8D
MCTPEGHHLCTVRLSGDFDAESIHVLREALDATCETTVIMDVTHVAFAGSSFLHALLEARRGVILAGPLPPQPARMLEATGARHPSCTPETCTKPAHSWACKRRRTTSRRSVTSCGFAARSTWTMPKT